MIEEEESVYSYKFYDNVFSVFHILATKDYTTNVAKV